MNGAPVRRSAFLMWGWAMLLVVLTHAAPMGGELRTRILGSAFDPATTSVALHPKRTKLASTAKHEAKPDAPVDLSADYPVPAPAGGTALAAPALPVDAAQVRPYAVAAAPERLLTRPLGTRAPPSA